MDKVLKNIYLRAVLFWFFLLIGAILNAVIRESTYKPLLLPYIGMWAHQISSLTGIIIFFFLIYLFLRKEKISFSRTGLLVIGTVWIMMTVWFETWMSIFVRKMTLDEILRTYYFWEGETWIFVLISLVISPQIVFGILKKKGSK